MVKSIGLDKYKKAMREKIKEVKFYVDRVNIRINNLASKEKVEEILDKHKKEFKDKSEFYDKTKYYKWKSVIGYTLKLYRPTDLVLKELEDVLFRVDYTFSAIELAADLITEDTSVACSLMQMLEPLVVAEFIDNKPTVEAKHDCELGSVYFGRFGEKADPKMFKMYLLKKGNDKHGLPALHTEIRFNKVENIEKQGLEVISDLVGLDYLKIYKDHVSIRNVVRKKVGEDIGRKRGSYRVSPVQNHKDFERVFGKEEFLAHTVFHADKVHKKYMPRWPAPWEIIPKYFAITIEC